MAGAADVSSGPAMLRHKNYTINLNHRLGSGSFGIVYMGEDTSTGTGTSTRKKVCAKHLNVGSVEFSQPEIDNMKRACGHANIVTIYDNFIRMNYTWIVMEYCPGDTLNEHLKKQDQTIQSRVKMIHQMTDAVKHLHTLTPPIAHRDLTPPNIIISPGPLVKVCDFGLSKTTDVTGSKNASRMGGTATYMPPELYTDIPRYDAFKADVFSLGLIFLGTITCSKDGNMAAFFTLEPGKAIGKLMYEQNIRNKPVNMLGKKILEFTNTNSDVMRLVSFLAQMVAFNHRERVDIQKTMKVVADVHQKVIAGASVETADSDSDSPSLPEPQSSKSSQESPHTPPSDVRPKEPRARTNTQPRHINEPPGLRPSGQAMPSSSNPKPSALYLSKEGEGWQGRQELHVDPSYHARDGGRRHLLDASYHPTPSPASLQIQGPAGRPITIHVEVGDITKLPVDAIVNAANSRLRNAGGVAGAISRAAGQQFDCECDNIIHRKGPIKVTENYVTQAGNLPCKNVVHALGPSIHYYKGKEYTCKIDLERTFTHILERAKECEYKSIAIPAISSGNFGVPIETVSEVMAKAVVDFLSIHNCQLRDVHLIDINGMNISLIQAEVHKKIGHHGSSSSVTAAPSGRTACSSSPPLYPSLEEDSGATFSWDDADNDMKPSERQVLPREEEGKAAATDHIARSSSPARYPLEEDSGTPASWEDDDDMDPSEGCFTSRTVMLMNDSDSDSPSLPEPQSSKSSQESPHTPPSDVRPKEPRAHTFEGHKSEEADTGSSDRGITGHYSSTTGTSETGSQKRDSRGKDPSALSSAQPEYTSSPLRSVADDMYSTARTLSPSHPSLEELSLHDTPEVSRLQSSRSSKQSHYTPPVVRPREIDRTPKEPNDIFARRTVLVMCVPKSYHMNPAKSISIATDINTKLKQHRIEGEVESVIYPVHSRALGVPGANKEDVAVVTFTTSLCAAKYSWLKPSEYLMMSETTYNFAGRETLSLPPNWANRIPRGYFNSFAKTMEECHGIHLKEVSGHYTLLGWDFQCAFLVKVINDIHQPVDHTKLDKYPFQLPTTGKTKRVIITYHLDKYLSKVGILEKLQGKYDVKINVEQAHWSLVCLVKGNEKHVRLVVAELERLKAETRTNLVKIGKSFGRIPELMELLQSLEKTHRGTAFHFVPDVGVWIVGDEDCTGKIYGKFPEILAHGSSSKIPKTIMVMDTDLLKYIIYFHSLDLADIMDNCDLHIDYEHKDGYSQFIIKGQRCQQANKHIGMLAERLAEKTRTETTPVTRTFSKDEMYQMSKEFKAFVEFDTKNRVIRIIADKTKVHEVKSELESRFGPPKR